MNLRAHLMIAEAYERAASRLSKAADAAKKRAADEWLAVWAHMDDEGWEPGDDTKAFGSRYGMQLDEYAVVQDALEFNEWAAEHAPHLIQPSPRKKLLNEEIRRLKEDGKPYPPGLGSWPKRWVSRRSV